MRLFVAIFPPEEIKKAISKVANSLKKLPMQAKFVEKQNLHISLCFLGERQEAELDQINLLLEQYLKKWKSIEIFVNGLKLIPSTSYFRVIAFEITTKEVDLMGKEISKLLNGDFKSAHLTVCRVKKVFDKKEVVSFASKISLDKSFLAKEVCLVKSKLTRQGPVYTIVKTYSL